MEQQDSTSTTAFRAVVRLRAWVGRMPSAASGILADVAATLLGGASVIAGWLGLAPRPGEGMVPVPVRGRYPSEEELERRNRVRLR
jgi:hypothetical protein